MCPLNIAALGKYQWLPSLTPREKTAIRVRAGGLPNDLRHTVQHCGMQELLLKGVLCLQTQKKPCLDPNWEKHSKTHSYLLPSNNSCPEASHLCLFAVRRLCTLPGQPRLEAACCDSLGRSLCWIKNSPFVFGEEGSPSLFQGDLLWTITRCSHLCFG